MDISQLATMILKTNGFTIDHHLSAEQNAYRALNSYTRVTQSSYKRSLSEPPESTKQMIKYLKVMHLDPHSPLKKELEDQIRMALINRII